jgi:hypothetical protein
MTLLELADRCEKATGPDRELDADIASSLGWRFRPSFRATMIVAFDPSGIARPAPRPTSSLDAAMSLVPEGWRVGEMGETVIECDDPWQVKLLEKRFSGERAKCAQGDAATPALALCAAALRSRSVRGEG